MIEFAYKRDGNLAVWEYPRLSRSYLIAVDMAEGLEHGDASIATVLSSAGDHVATYGGFGIEPTDFAEKLAYLGRWYRDALIAVEAQSHGYSVMNELKRLHRYNKLYYRKTFDERVKKTSSKIGWYTSVKTKPLMIDTMWRLLRTGVIRSRDKDLLTELTTFRKMPNGEMAGQPHDDRVMSFAIACMVWEEIHDPKKEREPDPEFDFDAPMKVDLWAHRVPSQSVNVGTLATTPRASKTRPEMRGLVLGGRR